MTSPGSGKPGSGGSVDPSYQGWFRPIRPSLDAFGPTRSRLASQARQVWTRGSLLNLVVPVQPMSYRIESWVRHGLRTGLARKQFQRVGTKLGRFRIWTAKFTASTKIKTENLTNRIDPANIFEMEQFNMSIQFRIDVLLDRVSSNS